MKRYAKYRWMRLLLWSFVFLFATQKNILAQPAPLVTPVIWETMTNFIVQNGSIRSAGVETEENPAIALSNDILYNGDNGLIAYTLTLPKNETKLAFGFSNDFVHNEFTSINYGFVISAGHVFVLVDGTIDVDLGEVETVNELKVARDGTDFVYFINGDPVYVVLSEEEYTYRLKTVTTIDNNQLGLFSSNLQKELSLATAIKRTFFQGASANDISIDLRGGRAPYSIFFKNKYYDTYSDKNAQVALYDYLQENNMSVPDALEQAISTMDITLLNTVRGMNTNPKIVRKNINQGNEGLLLLINDLEEDGRWNMLFNQTKQQLIQNNQPNEDPDVLNALKANIASYWQYNGSTALMQRLYQNFGAYELIVIDADGNSISKEVLAEMECNWENSGYVPNPTGNGLIAMATEPLAADNTGWVNYKRTAQAIPNGGVAFGLMSKTNSAVNYQYALSTEGTLYIIKNNQTLGSYGTLNTGEYVKIERKTDGLYFTIESNTGTIVLEHITDGNIMQLALHPFIRTQAAGVNPTELINASFLYSNMYTAFGAAAKRDRYLCGDETMDDDWNTVYTMQYDDNGDVYAAQKGYFDGLGRQVYAQALQLKDRNNATNGWTVLTTQTLYDNFGRKSLVTLPAPTGSQFCRPEAFITKNTTAAVAYDGQDYDISATNTLVTFPLGYSYNPGTEFNPNAVGKHPNTVGYYYSDNNTAEPYVATTDYPYIRYDYYPDPRGIVRQVSAPSDAKKMGSGKLGVAWTFPLYETMSNYLTYRNTILPNSLASLYLKGSMSVTIDADGRSAIAYADMDGNHIATASGTPVATRIVTSAVTVKTIDLPHNTDQSQKWAEFYIPAANFAVNITNSSQSQLVLENLLTGQLAIVAGTATTFTFPQSGFYKVTAGSDIQLSFNYTFSDFSYHYFDLAGRLRATTAPNGAGKTVYTNFREQYIYDAEGKVLQKTTVDAGTTNYLYRKDGAMRFSQNAKQLLTNKFSYAMYDEIGRSIEAGEYDPALAPAGSKYYMPIVTGYTLPAGYSFAGSIAEQADGLPTAAKKDPTNFYYDTRIAAGTTALIGTPYTLARTFLMGRLTATKRGNYYTHFAYNYNGQKTVEYQSSNYVEEDIYSDFGQLLQNSFKKINPSSVTIEISHSYSYYHDQSIAAVKKYGAGLLTDEAKYYYYKHGPLKRIEIGDKTQGLDYTYTSEGQLKAVNHPTLGQYNDPGADGGNGFAPDVFGYALDYYEGDYKRSNTKLQAGYFPTVTQVSDQYAGNIKDFRWRTNTGATQLSDFQHDIYAYTYDHKSQLLQAQLGSHFSAPLYPSGSNKYNTFTNKYLEQLTYDANGNIGTLLRYQSSAAQMDNLTYTYNANTNKLSQVADAIITSTGPDDIFGQAANNYAYDAIGQMTNNVKDAQYIDYDAYGKVSTVWRNNTKTLRNVAYEYDGNGNRALKRSYNSSGTLTKTTYYYTDAAGRVMAIKEYDGANAYQQSSYPIYGAGGRIGVLTSIGASNPVINTVYELTDHLGNVRATVNRAKTAFGQATVVSYTDYYATGLPMPGRQLIAANKYRFGYQGQYAERSDETGWSDFELRSYDARIARWLCPDPEEQYWSPYMAMGNDWVNMVDPNGAEVVPDGTMGPLKEGDIYASDYIAQNGGVNVGYVFMPVTDYYAPNSYFEVNVFPSKNSNYVVGLQNIGESAPDVNSSSTGLRLPDFYTLNFAVTIPNTWTGTLIGWNVSTSVDRHGQVFVSPFGFSVGKSASGVSGSITGNWMLQSTKPTSTETYNFLSGHGISVGGGYIGGANWSFSPTNSGTKHALGVGLYSPQGGVSYNYTPDRIDIFGKSIPFIFNKK